MKCPLFTIMDRQTQLGVESNYCNCLEEECAWWVDSSQKYTFREMRDWLESIDNYLYEITENMPSGETK